jgi:hypothetical protein
MNLLGFGVDIGERTLTVMIFSESKTTPSSSKTSFKAHRSHHINVMQLLLQLDLVRDITHITFQSWAPSINHTDCREWGLQLAYSGVLVSLKPRKTPWTASAITTAGAPMALNDRYWKAGVRMGDICSHPHNYIPHKVTTCWLLIWLIPDCTEAENRTSRQTRETNRIANFCILLI